jgi:alkanesulfonate monooxygenase SsuD/methylene tetrahydromethanopterin reductase-like flavin-dependent oxidoreductase (luciferase family)
MEAVEQAHARGEREGLARIASHRWLADTTLFGPPSRVREGFEAWVDAGVRTPILVPSAISGGQMKAIEELLAAFSA